ncbi:hypothetical protein LX36DRAFT_671649 [Colletotrichum falcatum]|nr:hypothetical protein LX36DRAFT_671649 [Colletotrichum falcatum]
MTQSQYRARLRHGWTKEANSKGHDKGADLYPLEVSTRSRNAKRWFTGCRDPTHTYAVLSPFEHESGESEIALLSESSFTLRITCGEREPKYEETYAKIKMDSPGAPRPTSRSCTAYKRLTAMAGMLTAYTYFRDPLDPNDEQLLAYYEGIGIDHHLYYDPLTCGEIDANKEMCNPRDYFFLVLKIHIKRIKKEWLNIVYHLKNRIIAYVETLSEVLESWTWFAEGDISHFANGASNKLILSIHSINTVMETDLRKVFTELNSLRARLDRFRTELDQYLQVAGHRAIILQFESNDHLQLISPMALSAATMQSEIIVFKPVLLCFMVLSALFWVIITYGIKPIRERCPPIRG